MKISSLLIASAIALAASPALAADKIAEIIDHPDNWSGVIVTGMLGANIGKADFEHMNVNNFGGPGGVYSNDATSMAAGFAIGYQRQFGRLVVGGELGLRMGPGSMDDGGEFAQYHNTTDSNVVFIGTAKGKLGYDFNGWMPYVTGGYAAGRVEASQRYAPPAMPPIAPTTWYDAKFASGYEIGAGLDIKVSEQMFVGLEYNHTDLGKVSFSGNDSTGRPTKIDGSFKSDSVFLRAGFRF